MYTDDECFFVGLGHRGQSETARKSNFLGSNEYRPFQCCPTKLERATKVPKMTAQRLAHKNDNEKSGYFQFNNDPKKESRVSEPAKVRKLTTAPVTPAATTPSTTISNKKSNADTDKKDAKPDGKKALAKGKDKGKQGQKGLLGIGKVVNWL